MGRKRQQKKERKRERKNGLNPVTGEVQTRKEAKRGRKFGYTESGTTYSKKQFKHDKKESRLGARIDRKDVKVSSKADAREVKADAEFVLAQDYGIDAKGERINAVMKPIASMTKDVTGVFTGNSSSYDEFDDFDDDYPIITKESMSEQTYSPKSMISSTMLILIGLLGYFMMKK